MQQTQNISDTVSNNKLCVFSTATDAYIPNAIVSLLSIRKYNPEYDLFVLCTNISDENRNLCAYNSVTPIEIDLSEAFYQEWKYPKECYYHFKAPEIFHALNYSHSIYIDGDMYCAGKLEIDQAESYDIAGCSYKTTGDLFTEIGEYEQIKTLFELSDSNFERAWIQSGVLIYNNSALQKVDYFNFAKSLYDLSVKQGVPRKGDDSLLALITTTCSDLNILVLPTYWNFVEYMENYLQEPITHDHANEIITNCVFYHLAKPKPWLITSEYPNYPYKYFCNKWVEVMINSFSQQDIKRCYPLHYKEEIIHSSEVKFYWFKSKPNFGDWITPYLAKKVCGTDAVFIDPLETKENVIISTGSIMRLSRANTIVWGSGIRDRNQDIKPAKLIRSSRGPITRARILEVGGECPPIYGDPALLLPRFYNPKGREKTYKLGIIPHVSQFEKVARLYENEVDVAVIDFRTVDVEWIVDKVLECRAIVSSSLHGKLWQMLTTYQLDGYSLIQISLVTIPNFMIIFVQLAATRKLLLMGFIIKKYLWKSLLVK